MDTEREIEYTEGPELGYYVEIVLRRWYLIVVPFVLCLAATAAFLLLQPVRYQAKVVIAGMRASSDTQGVPTRDETLDLTQFSDLPHSPGIAQAVLDQMGDRLPPEHRSTEALLEIADARVSREGDLIEIEVTHTDAAIAAEIADVWAREVVRQVNDVYSRSYGDALVRVQTEVMAAEALYGQTQSALESVLEQDQQRELERHIEELSGVLDALTLARLDSARSLLGELQRTESLLRSAQDMAEQLTAGGVGAAQSSGAALQALKLQVFGASSSSGSQAQVARLQPGADTSASAGSDTGEVVVFGAQAQPAVVQLQVGEISMSTSEMIADVNSVVAVLEGRQQALLARLQAGTGDVRGGDAWNLVSDSVSDGAAAETGLTDNELALTGEELEQQIRDLTKAAEQERIRLIQAETKRDLALAAYTELARREAELQLVMDSGGAELWLSTSQTIVRQDSNVLQNSVLAGIVGLVLGSIAVFGLEYWRSYHQPAETRVKDVAEAGLRHA
ncbi:MAG: GumC domain-containing protein [Anaerolineae bacterium]